MGLSSEDRGLMEEAPRRCLRAEAVPHPDGDTVRMPERVSWSSLGAREFHRCPDGEWGELIRIHPEPAGVSYDAGVRGLEGPQWPHGGEART